MTWSIGFFLPVADIDAEYVQPVADVDGEYVKPVVNTTVPGPISKVIPLFWTSTFRLPAGCKYAGCKILSIYIMYTMG